VVIERDIDRLSQPVGIKLHQPAGGERQGRKTHDRWIPAARRDVESIDQPAVHLIGNDDRNK
jgi:hypothetical protein